MPSDTLPLEHRHVEVTAQPDGGVTARFVLGGDLVIQSRDAIKRACVMLIEEQNVTRIEFDFTHAGYVDSTGLGVLLSLRRRLGDRNDAIVLHNLNEDLITLLELTRVREFFTVIEEEAACSPS